MPIHDDEDLFSEKLKKEKEKEQRKLPEFIIIDEQFQKQSFEEQEGNFSHEFNKIREIAIPLRLRIFFLLLGLVSIFWAIGALILFVIFMIPAAITFFRFENLNLKVLNFWNSTKRASVFALALILACFSPYLGLGLILMYFMMNTDKIKSGLFEKMMQSNLKDYLKRF